MPHSLLWGVSLLIPLVQAETTFFDNPDDAFIMGSPTTTPTADNGVTGEVTGGRGCLYKWNCTDWSECLASEKQTRNCTNLGTCPNTYKTPEIEQNCTYTAPEFEEDKESEKEIAVKNKLLFCFIIVLIILFIIIYLKKDYLRKLIKK